jgi:hypothetical protein
VLCPPADPPPPAAGDARSWPGDFGRVAPGESSATIQGRLNDSWWRSVRKRPSWPSTRPRSSPNAPTPAWPPRRPQTQDDPRPDRQGPAHVRQPAIHQGRDRHLLRRRTRTRRLRTSHQSALGPKDGLRLASGGCGSARTRAADPAGKCSIPPDRILDTTPHPTAAWVTQAVRNLAGPAKVLSDRQQAAVLADTRACLGNWYWVGMPLSTWGPMQYAQPDPSRYWWSQTRVPHSLAA